MGNESVQVLRLDDTASLTSTQRKYIASVRELGSIKAVARKHDVSPSTVRDCLLRAALAMGLSSHNELYVRQTAMPGRRITSKAKERKPRKNKNKAAVAEIVELVKVQNYRCSLSGIELTPDTASLDHKIPFSRGGSDMLDNLQWLNKEVNQAKGAMTNDEFILLCRRVVAWNS